MNLPLDFIEVPARRPEASFACAVHEGLSAPQKGLPARFFYDSAGSALFEQITRLPEYYLTRTEETILEDQAPAIVARAGGGLTLVEFGSGSSCKTRRLIEAALSSQSLLHYVPIDISSEFLVQSARRLLHEYKGLSITAMAAEYHDAIAALPSADGPRLVLFLGSNIGNFEDDEARTFLSQIRGRMLTEDRMLIGIDLLKDPAVIEAAYNDSQGVTAAFNKNILARINGELGGCFDLETFRHQAPFLEGEARVEMRLVSTIDQVVRVTALEEEFAFRAGEFIHTEDSHKYTLASFSDLCSTAGWKIVDSWLDPQRWFAEVMLEPA